MLDIKNLNFFYDEKQILYDINFHIDPSETLGLLGLSGCGKSTLAKIITGIEKDYKGEMTLNCDRPMMVFQDPFSSLNKSKKIGFLLEEPLKVRGVKSKKERYDRAVEMLNAIGLDSEFYHRYPGELSGGQRQRVCIGIALISGSKFIILDEPVSALDVTVQKKIMDLIIDLKKKYDLTYLFISHDIKVLEKISDRIIVMKDGKIVEQGLTADILNNPEDDFTKELLNAAQLG